MSNPTRNASMNGGNRLKLGVFTANCDGGQAATKVPERWVGSWDNNLRLARVLDEAGIEFMLPVARWNGYGGETQFQRSSLETITWATGVLANTRHMTVFGTVHTPLIHPVFAAKQCVTADHIGAGRFGLNIVCGWNDAEYRSFGAEKLEHDTRYAQGAEWLDVVQRCWGAEERFDHDGDYYHLRGVESFPKPVAGERPIVMNAGSSTAGRAFAARHCDFSLQLIIDPQRSGPENAAIKAQARALGRAVRILGTTYVVCRRTQQEALDYHRHYVDDNADWEAAENLMRGFMPSGTQSMPEELLRVYRSRFAGGHGTYPIIGDPDHVASEFQRISQAGFDGATLAFVNYLDEFPWFAQEVLPRLATLGLRTAA